VGTLAAGGARGLHLAVGEDRTAADIDRAAGACPAAHQAGGWH
jgi:hypothetical protein